MYEFEESYMTGSYLSLDCFKLYVVKSENAVENVYPSIKISVYKVILH